MNKQNELSKENIKLKEQNNLLMKKENNKKEINKEYKIEKVQEKEKENNKSNTYNSSKNNTIKNKKTKNNINGLMTYIKLNFKEKKSKMVKLDKYFLNKKKQNQDKIQEAKEKEKEPSLVENWPFKGSYLR